MTAERPTMEDAPGAAALHHLEQITQRDLVIAERTRAVHDLTRQADHLQAELARCERELVILTRMLEERDTAAIELQAKNRALAAAAADARAKADRMAKSLSWRLTAPLRHLAWLTRRRSGSGPGA
ncbi:hypothetical protein LXM94_22300 [Rhizobium sp. TRM95111]|uniref:hypothetical protein n=1 Tax=Rhizobium alarense TaxID=2846851 RepID=UPI001F1E8CBB|nr:hypothetical protein [Rhizobium alarense]MCF3642705.1 hypothetical protein [Rhizobium alarense]